MGFDLSTATPVEEQKTGGFDISTATPVQEENKTSDVSAWGKDAPGIDTWMSGKHTLSDVGRGTLERVKSLGDIGYWKNLGKELTSFPEPRHIRLARERGISPKEALNIPLTPEEEKQAEKAGEKLFNQVTGWSPFSAMSKTSRMALKPGGESAVEKLVSEGVDPTIGQRLGGMFKRTEDTLTSVPVVGDLIKGSQRRGIESFNIAALNRVLRPIGKRVGKDMKAGHEAVDWAHRQVSKSYEALMPKLKGKLDNEFMTVLQSTDDMMKTMPESQAKQFQQIVEKNLISKFDKSGNIYGESLKDAQSRIGYFLRKYKSSQNPDHQLLADALEVVRSSFDDMLGRVNPRHAETLKKINTSYANLVRVEKAASSLGAKEGIFTPAQLNQAVRATDNSLRKSGVARGKALMQDLAESGQEVLSQSVPDSGTALRLAPYLLAGGASYAGEQGFISPGAAAGIAGLSLAYTRPGQAVFRGIGRLGSNPKVGETLFKLSGEE